MASGGRLEESGCGVPKEPKSWWVYLHREGDRPRAGQQADGDHFVYRWDAKRYGGERRPCAANSNTQQSPNGEGTCPRGGSWQLLRSTIPLTRIDMLLLRFLEPLLGKESNELAKPIYVTCERFVSHQDHQRPFMRMNGPSQSVSLPLGRSLR